MHRSMWDHYDEDKAMARKLDELGVVYWEEDL
jgi:hypothetical protein